jgi:uncharacterized protein YjbJ (UPF0337 family)
MDTDRIEGNAKKVEGQVTGDESREAEGRLQDKWADAKESAGEKWEDLKDRAGRAVNERQERKEREKAS